MEYWVGLIEIACRMNVPHPEKKELEGLLKYEVLWPAHFPFRPVARYYPTVDELPLARPAALRPGMSIYFEHNMMTLNGEGAVPSVSDRAFAAVRQMCG